MIERGPVITSQRHFHNLFHTVLADDHRHADIKALHAVFAIQIGRAGQQAALILQIALRHLDRGRSGSIESRAGLQQADDLRAAVAGALHDAVDLFLCRPAHFHQFRHGDASDGGVVDQRHHGIAMATQHKGVHVFDGDVEFLSQEQAEAGAVQHAGHADDLIGGQAASLLQDPDHSVQRVGNANDESVRAVRLDASADRAHDLGVNADQVVAAHARLTGNAGGDNDDIRTLQVGIVVGAAHRAVEAFDRRALRQVQRFALGQAIDDVEHDDVAQFLQADEVSQRAADIAGADESDLVASHDGSFSQMHCCRNRRLGFSPCWRVPTPNAA